MNSQHSTCPFPFGERFSQQPAMFKFCVYVFPPSFLLSLYIEHELHTVVGIPICTFYSLVYFCVFAPHGSNRAVCSGARCLYLPLNSCVFAPHGSNRAVCSGARSLYPPVNSRVFAPHGSNRAVCSGASCLSYACYFSHLRSPYRTDGWHD